MEVPIHPDFLKKDDLKIVSSKEIFGIEFERIIELLKKNSQISRKEIELAV